MKEAKPASPIVDSGKARVAFSYSYEAKSHALRECILTFTAKRQGESFSLRMPPKPHGYVLAFAEPGYYELTEVKCLGIGNFLPTQKMADVQVQSGKINYEGHLKFVTEKDGTYIRLNYSHQRPVNTAGLKQLFKDLTPQNEKQVISGFSGRPITADMIREEQSGFITQATPSDAFGEDLRTKFIECASSENALNPGAVGEIKAEFGFKRGKLVATKVINDRNSFTPGYFACIKNALENPPSKHKLSKLELTLY